ncbi:MAG TPA: pseudouridine synthase, partial [Nitrospiraceae bacterium]|nr:pseudouridine synthase [Nitrospiraceae bacterium]
VFLARAMTDEERSLAASRASGHSSGDHPARLTPPPTNQTAQAAVADRRVNSALVQMTLKSQSRRRSLTTPAHTIVFNKPYGVLPCFTDPKGRPTLADYIKVPGVYAAGRLDFDSEGLMILTSDGALIHRITDPEHVWPKVYLVQVERIPDEDALRQLRQGVLLKGVRTRPAEVRVLSVDPELPERPVPIRYRRNVPTAWLELTIREGQNRQVRRMTAAVGHPTLRLVRIAIGPVVLEDLKPGQWRELMLREIKSIAACAKLRRLLPTSLE